MIVQLEISVHVSPAYYHLMTNENDDDYKVFNMTITTSRSLLNRLGNVLNVSIIYFSYESNFE